MILLVVAYQPNEQDIEPHVELIEIFVSSEKWLQNKRKIQWEENERVKKMQEPIFPSVVPALMGGWMTVAHFFLHVRVAQSWRRRNQCSAL
jgi:hypothetical protein